MAMNILHRHLYRTSSAEDEDKPAITIPFSTLLQVIETHEKQQVYLDISHGIKKRRYDKEDDNYDASEMKNMEDVDKDIDRFLKKSRI
jgi:hypothetical protein